MCRHYLVETYDNALERRIGNWFLASLVVACMSYFIVVFVLEASSYKSLILVVGFLVVAPLMVGYRVVGTRRFIGNIGTKSIGRSNM